MPFYIKSRTSRKEIVETIMGRAKADTILRNGRIVNVSTGEICEGDVSIKGDRIACVGDAQQSTDENTKIIDVHDEYVVPGLLDGHIHPESSMLTLTEFAKALLTHGTAGILADMHEITNVLGVRGLRLFMNEASTLPVKIFVAVPSSVPICRADIEVPANRLDLKDIGQILDSDFALSLGEVLNAREVLQGNLLVHQKIEAAISRRKVIDGNAPKLTGNELNAYVAAGAQHDHEAINVEEGLERLRSGMWLMLREGSSERNMEELIKIIRDLKIDPRHCCFATDDKDARDLVEEGHMDHCVRKAISNGIEPMVAVQMATINCAEYLEIDREMGTISPGKIADILIVDDLESFRVSKVFLNGKLVAENGKCLMRFRNPKYPNWALNTFKIKPSVHERNLSVKVRRSGEVKVRVIDVSGGSVVSDELIEEMSVQKGELKSDVSRDILKLSVVERHGKTHPPTLKKGFAKGFGLKRGALASSVAHDTHNIIAVGADDEDLALAINTIIKIQGGLTVVSEGKIHAFQSLPLGGIVSTDSIEKIVENVTNLRLSAKALGCKIDNPFMVLSFQSSASIPKLKLSTRGLIDADSMKIVSLIAD